MPPLSSWWPMLKASIGAAPLRCSLTPTAGRCAMKLPTVSPSCAVACSGRVSVSLRNWSKRSGIAIRAGGMRTLATPAAGSSASSAPLITRPLIASIWHGSGSLKRCGAA
jgi:hypothetical protein